MAPAVLVSLVSPEKVQAFVTRARLESTEVGSDALASMLLAASHVYAQAASEQFTEWVRASWMLSV